MVAPESSSASDNDLKGLEGGVLSATSALRLLFALLALWTLLSGLALVFFQDSSDATIG